MNAEGPVHPSPTTRTPLTTLIIVSVIAQVGTKVSTIAIPWFVLSSTGSVTLTGLVAAFELAPYVAVKALGGPLVDRIGQRRVSFAADFGSAAVIGLIPMLHLAGALPLPLLLILVAVAGALRGPGDNAKQTTVPLVADSAGVPLERVTGIFGAVERGSGLVAPAVAAGMITFVGAPWAVAITAGCFGVSGVIVFIAMPKAYDQVSDATSTVPNQPGYLAQLRDGFQFLIKEPLLRMFAIMIAVTNLLDIAKVQVLLPVWSRDNAYGVAAIGLVLTVNAAASTVTSLLAGWLGPRLPRRIVYFGAFLIAGPTPFVVLGFDWPLWAVAVTYGVAGAASGFLNPMLGAILFERTPRSLLGRVGGLTNAIAWSGMPFGGLVAAGLFAMIGLSPALLVLGGCYLVTTVVPGLLSRGMFDRPAVVSTR